MKDVSFGQYYPANSFVHKMDPRVKILMTIAYIVAVFLVKSFHFLGFAACFLYIVVAVIFSKINFFKILKSVKVILFFVILSAVLQIFFNGNGNVLLKVGSLKITDIGLINAGFIVARIILVVTGASLLTLTTSPIELADGIESLLTPLKLIRFPVHEFALIMSIALRFIPDLLDETDRIIKAQKARGADFESGNLFKRAKALIPVIVPLLISSFRRAEDLSNAMDARCYAGSKTRTKYKKMKITFRDPIGVFIMAGLITGVVFLNKFYILLIL